MGNEGRAHSALSRLEGGGSPNRVEPLLSRLTASAALERVISAPRQRSHGEGRDPAPKRSNQGGRSRDVVIPLRRCSPAGYPSPRRARPATLAAAQSHVQPTDCWPSPEETDTTHDGETARGAGRRLGKGPGSSRCGGEDAERAEIAWSERKLEKGPSHPMSAIGWMTRTRSDDGGEVGVVRVWAGSPRGT